MKLTPLRILGIGWGVFLFYAYPGYLDAGAGDMLLDARANQFGDWYSPVMARVWWVLSLVFAGPPGMLVLQSLLFLGGAYALLRRVSPDRTAAALACGVLLFPPILGIEGVVSAASLFTGFALAGTALLTSRRPRRKIGGLALLLVAADFHPAAPFAIGPLVVLGFEWRAGMPRVRRYAIAVVAFLAILGGSFMLERSIVDVRGYRKEMMLAKHDINGIAKQLGTPIQVPDDTLVDARRQLIGEHPGAYVKHRLRHLGLLLVSTSKLQTTFVQYQNHAVVLSYRARHSPIQRALIAPVKLVSHTPLVRPVVYLVLALGVLVLALVRAQRTIAVLIASAIAWELGAAFFTTSTDGKNSHWLVVAAVLGAALLWVALRHRDDRAHRALEVDADRAAVPVE